MNNAVSSRLLGLAMKTQQVIMMERRQRSRQAVLAEIKNLTYNALRRYGINGQTEPPSPSNVVEKAA